MTIVDEIIELAANDAEPIGNLLRKCLILAYRVNNDAFKQWLNYELDGYDHVDDLPGYRKVRTISRGHFIGIAGTQLHDQPLNLAVLGEKDRDLMAVVRLAQPIASYDGRPNKSTDATMPWPPHLTTKYQEKFMPNLVLNRAWQEIPGSCLVGLTEMVRNRVLRFALELRGELHEVDDKVEALPPTQVQQSVVNHIYNGNVVVAGSAEQFNQIQNTSVVQNDLEGLATALKELGLGHDDVLALEKAVEEDGKASLGMRTAAWLKELPATLGRGTVKVGFQVAKAAATKYVMQYFGLC